MSNGKLSTPLAAAETAALPVSGRGRDGRATRIWPRPGRPRYGKRSHASLFHARLNKSLALLKTSLIMSFVLNTTLVRRCVNVYDIFFRPSGAE